MITRKPMTNFTDHLLSTLQDDPPQRLDDIIPKHRDEACLRLSTEGDLQCLHGEIPLRRPDVTIDDWRFLTIEVTGMLQTYLLGVNSHDGAWITSAVTGIDLGTKLVRTESGSVYGLGGQGDGDPPADQLELICWHLHKIGIGARLGVPHLSSDREINRQLPKSIHAAWDQEANVWMAECQELGLATEAESLEALIIKLKSMVPELIEANQIKGWTIVYVEAEFNLRDEMLLVDRF